ncbi:MAG TPA: ABC transporter permease [Acidobacteria bacterium]|nr:ABC transporter permease [Acidobacteriota bacterium]
METLLQDLRYSLRTLLTSPRFTLAALLALALGIGANTAIFSVVNAILLKPLPYPEPDRIVLLWVRFLGQGITESKLSGPELIDFRNKSQVFERLAAGYDTKYNLTGGGEPERVQVSVVSADLFDILGARAEVGRTFTHQEDSPGNDTVALLSHDFWVRRFGARRDVIGTSATLGGQSFTIIGVMPAGFAYPSRETVIWLPLGLDPADRSARFAHYLSVIGRLKPNVSLEQAQQEVAAVGRQIQVENQPEGYYLEDSGWGAFVQPLRERIVGEVRPALLLLVGAVGFVLLIACANVANLILARSEGRQQEMALRTAIGAGRGRISRQLMTESLCLSLAGGALGLLLASWGVHLLVALDPPNVPRLSEASSLDGRVLLVSLAISLATGIIFGLAPLFHSFRININEALKEGGRTSTDRTGEATRRMLIVSEVGLSLVLLIGAALAIESFVRLQKVDPGFRAKGVLTAQLVLPRAKYREGSQQAAFFHQLAEEVRALPGVQAVGLTAQLPLTEDDSSGNITLEGRPLNPGEVPPEVNLRTVDPGYFAAMGIPVVIGRPFAATDTAETPTAAVIDQSMARRFWPDGQPLGKRLKLGGAESEAPWMTVVGVVGDVKHHGLDLQDKETVYLAQAQLPQSAMSLVVRSASSSEALAKPLRELVRNLDPDLPVARVATLENLLQASLSRPRFNLLLITILALLALVLTVVGIYSVISYSVLLRTREIAIRMAIGSDRGGVLKLIMRQVLTYTGFGVGAGLVGAVLLTRLMSSLLFEVKATNLPTFLGVSLLLLAIAAAAGYIPARRATLLDPQVVLRRRH